jgi:uncharacterized protein YfdQ (DUF2303 family)
VTTPSSSRYSDQTDFAEFIQDHITNFVEPNGATMLELAESFQTKTSVDFDSSHRVKSGETQLSYIENTQASAGRKGELTIPDTFRLGVQVHERGPAFAINARFRYRIVNKSLRLGYRLERPGDVVNAAFDELAGKVTAETGHAVWHGTPTGRR